MIATSQPPDSLGALLAAGRDKLRDHSDSPRLDAELLLARVTGASRASLYANPDKEIGPSEAIAYLQLLNARAGGQPVAYLTGEREFWSLTLRVNEHTLIPRPETEHLVEAALARIPADARLDLLEVGTGSGAVAAAIATERPGCRLTATDIDPAALEVARDNLNRHNCKHVELLESDWFSSVPASRSFDLIISNPPYVPTRQRDMTDASIAFEPQHALFSGADGLDAIRTICSTATQYLKPGGWLILEHGFDQARDVARLLDDNGFDNVVLITDLSQQPRVSAAQTTMNRES